MMLRKIGYTAVIAVSAAAFVLGSAATGEAKAKKKMEAAAPMPPACQLAPPQPVCGLKGGMKFNYANACYAERDGAKVVSSGACPAKAMKKGKKKKK
jgi:hypothetical protein